jgi:uncharacterized membrane protein
MISRRLCQRLATCKNMHPGMLRAFLLVILAFAPTPAAMGVAGVVLFVIGVLAAKNDLSQARGLDKMAMASNLCFAIPLAAFGAEHFAETKSIMQGVPAYMPWPLFWTYFVGCALLAAALSMATKIQVRWSGLLFGIMMFLFVAMMDLPTAVANRDRISCTLLARELSFGGAGWVLAGAEIGGKGRGKMLFHIGRVLVAMAAILFAVEQFLHPFGLPAVPLEKQMPAWIPARALIGYLTGAFLLGAGILMLRAKQARRAATYLGTWIVLMVLLIYVPVLIASQLDPSPAAKLEGANYFFDTLLFGGAVLAVAHASPAFDPGRPPKALSAC